MEVSNFSVAGEGNIVEIAHTKENHFHDDMLEYYFNIEIQSNPELKEFFRIIKFIINREKLKMRFGSIGIDSKYRELAKTASKIVVGEGSDDLVLENNLDDGYKSTISSILNIAMLFDYNKGEKEDEFLIFKLSPYLKIRIKSVSLNIEFNNISNLTEYKEALKAAEDLKTIISPFIYCASSFSNNFFKFHDVSIFIPENLDFIDEEIKFKVSHEIIPKLIEPLYGNSPECGLREIIQNAFDACKLRSINESTYKPLVRINFDIENTTGRFILTIRDNGIGMTKEILSKKYFVIGESTKKELEEGLIGQFGIGALASFLLGDVISVETKSIDDKSTVLSFNYTYEDSQDQFIEIRKRKDTDFECGTEIKVTLKESFSNKENVEIKEKIEIIEKDLKIHEWYLLPEIELEYKVMGEEKEIRSLIINGNQNWEMLRSVAGLEVDYLSHNKGQSQKFIGKVIYNGILIPESYDLKSDYIINRPCVKLVDKKRIIKLDLSRSKVLNPEIFVDELRNQIYFNAFENLQKPEEISRFINNGNILSFNYASIFIKSVPLLFCKDGFGIYSINTINKLKATGKYKWIINVYECNYSDYININNFEDDCIYIFNIKNLQKSEISYLIASSGETHIPQKVLKKYFYNAVNSNIGFKKETMEKIYKSFEYSQSFKRAEELWSYHTENKEKLFSEKIKSPWTAINKIENINSNLDVIKNVWPNCIIKVSYISYFYDSYMVKDSLGEELIEYI